MEFGRKSLPWVRLACVVVTLAALFFVIRRIHVNALLSTLRAIQPAWFVGAVILYGILFLPASWRWRLALRLSDNAVGFSPIVRVSLIGHFFYVIFFGAAGGDAAKSALYARWYRFPLPKILAAASLDRLMGLGGLIFFCGLAFAVAAFHGAFAGLKSLSFHWPYRFMGIAVAVVVIGVLWLKFSKRGSAVRRFAAAFRESGKRLLSSPGTLWPGLACGFLVQVALSGALALNLQAVSPEPLPWLKLLWTFPLISVIGALPVTAAGLGARDTAALVLLGFCGVPGKNAVAASLLMAAVSIVWAVVAGALWWVEGARQKARDRAESKLNDCPVEDRG